MQKAAPAARQNQFAGIDLLKFILSIFVVGIHVAPIPADAWPWADKANFWLQMYLFRLAVPFYFTASGFLLFRKLDPEHPDGTVVRDQCFRLLRLLGLWTVVLVVGEKGHLWYLKSVVAALALAWLCICRRMRPGVLAALAAVMYAVGLLGDSYYGLLDGVRTVGIVDRIIRGYDSVFQTTRNGLFMGFPYVLMGAYFAWNRPRLGLKGAAAGFVLSMVLLAGEVWFLESRSLCKGYNMYALLMPATFFLFALSLELRLPHVRGNTLRVMGMLIYLSHILCRAVLLRAFGGVEKILFPAVVLASVLLSWTLARLSRREKMRWLRWLYQ